MTWAGKRVGREGGKLAAGSGTNKGLIISVGDEISLNQHKTLYPDSQVFAMNNFGQNGVDGVSADRGQSCAVICTLT